MSGPAGCRTVRIAFTADNKLRAQSTGQAVSVENIQAHFFPSG